MNLEIKKISHETLQTFYDNFEGQKTFLQNTQYGKFREALGETLIYIGIFDKKNLVGTALIQKVTTKLKTFLHCPHGPLLQTTDNKEQQVILSQFLAYYKELGRGEGCDFVRISPLLSPDQREAFTLVQFRDAPTHLVNPEKTWILDITPTEDELLTQMKKSTRYEVRQITKKGLEVIQGNSSNDLNIFWELHSETVKRQGFTPFPRKNTEIELDIFGNNCQIFSTKVENEYLSASVILFDDHAAYYHQGSSKYSKLPVAHATIWEAIKEAKKRGCKEFNFWGVVSDNEKKHPWYGLSRFKRGFGGREENYLHCQDFPITWKYWISFVIEKYRKWKKGY